VISDGPVRPTNATPKYRGHVKVPHPVVLPTGGIDQRWCVTTRDNGLILATVDIQDAKTWVTVKVAKG
jgi:hypothetical protein